MALVVLVFISVIVVAVVTASHSHASGLPPHPEPRELVRRAVTVVPPCTDPAARQAVIDRVVESDPRVDVVVVEPAAPALPPLERITPRVTVLRPELARTAGDALRAGAAWGMREDYDAVIELAEGCQGMAGKVTSLLEALEDGAHVAVGSRHVPGSRITACATGRRLVSRHSNGVLRRLAHLPLHDVTARIRAYRREAVAHGMLRTHGHGPSLGVEVLLRCRHAGLRFAEVPVATSGPVCATASPAEVRAAVAAAMRWRGAALQGFVHHGLLRSVAAMFGAR